jgi:hypothetical protein
MNRKPDTAELELADFIRRAEETLDEPGQRQLEAALRYLQGREEAVRLDKRSIKFRNNPPRISK